MPMFLAVARRDMCNEYTHLQLEGGRIHPLRVRDP